MITLAVVALVISLVCLLGIFIFQNNDTAFICFMVTEIVSAFVFMFALGGMCAVM